LSPSFFFYANLVQWRVGRVSCFQRYFQIKNEIEQYAWDLKSWMQNMKIFKHLIKHSRLIWWNNIIIIACNSICTSTRTSEGMSGSHTRNCLRILLFSFFFRKNEYYYLDYFFLWTTRAISAWRVLILCYFELTECHLHHIIGIFYYKICF
jgi:hypothetical protein